MRLSKHKLEAIEMALKLAVASEKDKREKMLEALHWAQEQMRKRAEGQRSYVGAK